jgi:hypothetical protein
MSQHYTARQLASYGRGPDTELVHMSKKEIKGLQELAMAHGGSLTINPNTGLAEAGFLSKILPMVAGAALAATGVGAPMAALMVGGGMGIAKGSLKEGLMAGLSAYGGAGLASGLAAAGTSTAVDAAGTAAAEQATTAAATEAAKATAGQQIGQEASKNALLEGITLPSDYAQMAAQQATPSQIAQAQAQNYLSNASNTGNLSAETVKGLQGAVPNAQNPLDIVSSAGRANASLGSNIIDPTTGQYASNVGQGIKSLATNPSQLASFAGNNVGTLASLALPALEGEQKSNVPGYQPDEYDKRLGKYHLASNYKAYEAPQPNPYYKAQYEQYANGGVIGLAMGGMPPQTNFANPSQSMMGTSQYDMPIDPMSGNIANRMAEGGIARFAGRGKSQVIQDYLDRQQKSDNYLPESVGVPRTGIFRDTDIETYKKPAFEASVIRLGKAYGAAGIKPAKLPKTSIKGLGDVSGATPDTTEAAGGGTMRSHLGGYSDGGRMLKGPGDGMSDDIPATISGKQPARLADGEFVVPADVVSHLGNGSTDAGAKKLYSMMAKIRKARTGKKKQAPAVKADRFMPA